jgi:hypothetical protein
LRKGIWSLIPDLRVFELISARDVDFVVADMEHGNHNFESLRTLVLVAKANGTSLTIRTADSSAPALQRIFDSSPEAVQIAGLRSLGEASKIADRILELGYSPWVPASNQLDFPKVALQIEFAKVFSEFIHTTTVLPELFSAAFLGRYDLSKTLKHELCSRDDYSVCSKFLDTCAKLSLSPWTVAIDAMDANNLGNMGFHRISLLSDVALLQSAD